MVWSVTLHTTSSSSIVERNPTPLHKYHDYLTGSGFLSSYYLERVLVVLLVLLASNATSANIHG